MTILKLYLMKTRNCKFRVCSLNPLLMWFLYILYIVYPVIKFTFQKASSNKQFKIFAGSVLIVHTMHSYNPLGVAHLTTTQQTSHASCIWRYNKFWLQTDHLTIKRRAESPPSYLLSFVFQWISVIINYCVRACEEIDALYYTSSACNLEGTVYYN